jgi:hypothetical protein
VIDLTNVLAGRSVDLGPLDVFARNAFVVGMGSCACLLMTFAFSIQLRSGCSSGIRTADQAINELLPDSAVEIASASTAGPLTP